MSLFAFVHSMKHDAKFAIKLLLIDSAAPGTMERRTIAKLECFTKYYKTQRLKISFERKASFETKQALQLEKGKTGNKIAFALIQPKI